MKTVCKDSLTPRYLLYRALGALPYIVGTWGVRVLLVNSALLWRDSVVGPYGGDLCRTLRSAASEAGGFRLPSGSLSGAGLEPT